MENIEIYSKDFEAAAAKFKSDEPVTMVNLVRYREKAVYEITGDEPTCSGRECYLMRYAPAFNRVAEKLGVSGVRVLYLGSLAACLVGDDEGWDDIILVEYPNFDAFRTIIGSDEYLLQASHHRKAALEKWHLIASKKFAIS